MLEKGDRVIQGRISVPLPSHCGFHGQGCEVAEWRQPSSPLLGSPGGNWVCLESHPSRAKGILAGGDAHVGAGMGWSRSVS